MSMSQRKFIFVILLGFILFVFLFCEYLIYYIVLAQCGWPEVESEELKGEENASTRGGSELRVMLIADTHLLGSRRGHWFDKLRREWQMYRAFQTAVSLHQPQVIFFLGDLFDEGLWCSDDEFATYVQRFRSLFMVPKGVRMYAVVGNHDVGFHYWITPYLQDRFVKSFKSPSVQLLTLSGSNFVLLNSMAMEGDGCHLCRSALVKINQISKKLNCSRGTGKCETKEGVPVSRPILLQHFPLYRESDELCDEPDEAPDDIKSQKFREKWDSLSKESSNMLLESLNPRVVMTGHTHHGCHRYYEKLATHEYTIPSFNWRNKDNPSFMLAVFTPTKSAVSKCMMPKESTVCMVYLCGFFAALLFLSFSLRWVRRKILFKIH